MSEAATAPERLWAFDYDLQDNDGAWRNWQCWSDSDPKPLNGTEYIRADLTQAKDAEIERLRAELDAAQAQVAVLREALDKARDPGRDPDYCYDDDWECTMGFDQAYELMENHDLTEPVEFYTLFKGPRKWAVNVPNSWDEGGIPDGWDTEIFGTEAEARAALTPAAKTGGAA